MKIDIDKLIERISLIYTATPEDAFNTNLDELIQICLRYMEDTLFEEFTGNKDHYISIYTKAKENAQNS